MQNLGIEIRKRRGVCKLTLKALAERIGVTSSFLSQIEKGKASPSLVNLKKIANALDTTVSVLVADADSPQQSPVLRRSARRTAVDPSTGITTEILTAPRDWKMMEPMLFTFAKRARHSAVRYRHVGNEFAFVLKGELKVVLGDQEYLLKDGDSIYFSSGTPHVLFNASASETKVLSINTPPNF